MFYAFVFSLLSFIIGLGIYVEKRNQRLKNHPSSHKASEDANYLVGDNKYTSSN
ncbi:MULTISPECIES: hypothetical protein [Bacillales]|uniref:Uncharacterized protein n=1 Tax=Lysinibacillus louembei TaxID=1470088 RepID=A0ABZ0RYU8_9BACI|nr:MULTISPECIES: hypothetical protein [Bacillales]MCT6923800.1 hypothetical protein [Metasolibacillus sp.]MCT6939967.1 hypothetical protein [Metasolibacillus sp.]WPK13422.1 hypothetical protein R6U77_07030 [Lysinibacillus louembei]